MDDLRNLKLLTVADLVSLGIGSRATIYRMLERGDLPCIRRGRSVRVRQVDVEVWMDAGGSTANVVPFRRRNTSRKSA